MDDKVGSARQIGEMMHQWARDLFPINRSLSGEGNRETLAYLKDLMPDLRCHSIASGTRVFDWTVPKEWRVSQAYIETPTGERICDFAENNLHLVGYSDPFNGTLTLSQLRDHLHTLPDRPDWIPYVTAYYKDYWGFCISYNQLQDLPEGDYKVVVDAELFDGEIDFADVVIPGETDREIMFSTYICHPSMANNELSGPVVTAALAQFVASLPSRHYTYRFVFIPETIGALIYLDRNLAELQAKTDAGFVVTCVGDDRTYSYIPSISGDTTADRVIRYVFQSEGIEYDAYDFLDRGSDERQYCWPGVELPVASVTRSKYGTYPEYHTSADDLMLVTPSGLQGAVEFYQKCIRALEQNRRYKVTTIGEPQLGRRGLRSELSIVGANLVGDISFASYTNWLAYSDGNRDVIDIATRLNLKIEQVEVILERLIHEDLLAEVSPPA